MKLPSWFVNLTLRKAATANLFLVGAAWVVTRFCGLGVSPPGFFMDETAPAIHAMCLAQTGKDADGVPWPLYSSAAGGGHHPITLIAFDIVWTKIFGTSRAAFRAVSAFWILVTAVGLFFIARAITNLMPAEVTDARGIAARRALPWMVLLAALLSPWGFQFSRVGWEAPLAPTYMILSVLGLLHCQRGGRLATVWGVFAGFCAAASMSSYPPLRAVVPLVFLTVVGLLLALPRAWDVRWNFIKRILAAGIVAAACFSPTLRMLEDGKINERMNNVAIWNDRWVKDNAGDLSRWTYLAKAFLDNLALHLRPSFLFIDGDSSLRHNPHLTGQLSPLDALALLFVLWMAVHFVVRLVRGRTPLPDVPNLILAPTTRWLLAVGLCAIVCGLFGLASSALTFEAIPHAMRSIGAWPFVALFTGVVLTLAWTHRNWVPPTLASVALVYTLYFLPAYFYVYDKVPNHWFMRDMTDVLVKERRENPAKSAKAIILDHLAYAYSYDDVPRYYLMTEAQLSCDEAIEALRAYRAAEKGQ
jgi:hypothetical protein